MEALAVTNPEKKNLFRISLKLSPSFSGEQDVQTMSSAAQGAHLQIHGTSGSGTAVQTGPARTLLSRSGSFQRQTPGGNK
jgi:hypothetical protein